MRVSTSRGRACVHRSVENAAQVSELGRCATLCSSLAWASEWVPEQSIFNRWCYNTPLTSIWSQAMKKLKNSYHWYIHNAINLLKANMWRWLCIDHYIILVVKSFVFLIVGLFLNWQDAESCKFLNVSCFFFSYLQQVSLADHRYEIRLHTCIVVGS